VNLNDYIEKLRMKPARERERIAVIATGVSFAVILVIWLVSFSEMNKSASSEAGSVPVQDQLEELKKNAGESKQSIEEMMQSLPQGSTGLENLDNLGAGSQKTGTKNQSQDTNNSQDNQLVPSQDQGESAPAATNNGQKSNQPGIPNLP